MALKKKIFVTRMVKVEGEPETLSERVQWLRYSNGWKQQDIADLIGCTRSNYANKESSAHGWSYEQLRALAVEFNLNMNWLYFGEGRPYLNKPREAALEN